MPGTTRIGSIIHQARLVQGLSLRELARSIGKSPSYIVALERSSSFPGSTDDTIIAIAEVLALNPDELFSELNRAPIELHPSNPIEVALYRIVKSMTAIQQKKLLNELQRRYPGVD